VPVPQKKWILAEADLSVERRLSHELSIGPITAHILASRGLTEVGEAARFLNPRLADLPQPTLLAGAPAAARRIADAVERGEPIAVHGDYDADGVTATALVTEFFRTLGHPVEPYVPSRFAQGYGFSPESARDLAARGNKLLITVDCGANDHEAVRTAGEVGMDVIVTDHHEIAAGLPPALAVINPHRPECGFHCEQLAGVGLAFFLVAAVRLEMQRRGRLDVQRFDLKNVLDLVALGTVADIVPLVGVNRVLVFHGLRRIAQQPRPGLRELMKVANVECPVNCGDISYRLAPRINAAGRLGDASIGIDLLLTQDEGEARRIAQRLHEENTRRQEIEVQIFNQAQKMIERIPRNEKLKTIVLAHPSWHEGVIGVVASRLSENYHRPTVLITADKTVSRGSGRSIPGFNLYEALGYCREHLEQFGGHEQAAGVTIRTDRIVVFAKSLEEYARRVITAETLVPKLRVDAWCGIDEISETLIRELAQLAPFGFGNSEPILAARDIEVINKQIVGKDHLKLRIPWRRSALAVIAFGFGKLFDEIGSRIDLAFSPEFNHYGGKEQIQLRARDVALPFE